MSLTYIPGADLSVGDVIDYTPAGFVVARFGPYDSPLIPITGPGRIAYAHDGSSMAVYDKHPVRIRVAPRYIGTHLLPTPRPSNPSGTAVNAWCEQCGARADSPDHDLWHDANA